MSRNHLNVVLLLVVLALGAGTWWASQREAPAKEKLTALATDGVSSILVEWPGSPAIHLERKDGQWWLTSPVQARADRFEAIGAASLAGTEVQQALDGEGLDAKELGLEPPDHVVTLNDVKVEFGGQEPLQSRRYVRVAGAVKLIDDPATASLDKDYADLVAKNLFDAVDPPVRIELPGLTLSRGADGQWSAPPGTANATPAALKSLAEGWINAQAMWNEAAPGPAPAGERLRFTLQSGAQQEYVVAATDPQFALYVPALKIRHQLSKALADELLKLRAAPQTSAEPGASKS